MAGDTYVLAHEDLDHEALADGRTLKWRGFWKAE